MGTIAFCESCQAMTYTIKGRCGKCQAPKLSEFDKGKKAGLKEAADLIRRLKSGYYFEMKYKGEFITIDEFHARRIEEKIK